MTDPRRIVFRIQLDVHSGFHCVAAKECRACAPAAEANYLTLALNDEKVPSRISCLSTPTLNQGLPPSAPVSNDESEAFL